MMKGRQFPILPILLMGAIGVCVYWIYKNIEFEEIEYQVGRTDVARANQFLAAARLMEKEGFNFTVAEDRGVFSSLNVNNTDVLWLANVNELSNEEEVNQIQTWIESGGTLLTSPRYSEAFDKSSVSGELLERLGIESLSEYELENMLDELEYSENQTLPSYYIDLPETDQAAPQSLTVSYSEPYFKNANYELENDQLIINSPHLIHKRIGKGYLTVYADPYLFDNDNIALYDHGYLLLWLTQPAQQKKLSIVFRPADKPGLFSLLWNRFTLAILLLLGVLIGYLRWASSRLGPIEHELPPVQNNLMAHLEARGEYWYRHKYTDKIVENVQGAAINNLAKLRGVASAHGEIDKTEAISEASKMLQCSPVNAEHALYGKTRSDSAILNASRILQKINHHKPTKPKS